ncbi:sporulation peptidase YabG [Clostridium mediterraneense]|uniref:sporulation peptidase YabG n=1 Tax=Clostridium mediterraneense TaxID=1805472 RepID=UPI00082F8DA4|nr:sporulation peptidase YabG [Clostridium mediterraneense]
MNIGDLVSRKSYNSDIGFIIKEIQGNHVILSGINYRLIADTDIHDLDSFFISPNLNNLDTLYTPNKTLKQSKLAETCYTSLKSASSISDKKLGLILHIDSDKVYLKRCIDLYKKFGVKAIGFNIPEKKQPFEILDLLKIYNPNILILTGHDALAKDTLDSTDINNYKNSKYYVESAKIARHYNKNYDDLVIFAGGCQSYYEEIMNAGANFASSPNRVLINVTDPVYLAYKFASTSIRDFLDIDTIFNKSKSSIGDIGGVETRGQCRNAKPFF